MTTEKELTPDEKAARFRDMAKSISASFTTIKGNPLNLNLLMAHVGALSLAVDEILNELATKMDTKHESTPTIN